MGVALSHMTLGRAVAEVGDLTAAFDHYTRAIGIAEALVAKQPSNSHFPRHLRLVYTWMGNLRKLAQATAAGGDRPGAVKLLHEALDLLHALKEQYPSNRELEPDLHSAYLALADTLLASGQSDEALVQYREALRIAETAYSSAPTDLLALWRHALSCERLGDFYAARAAESGGEQRSDWLEAQDWYERSTETWREWQRFGVSGNFNSRHESRVLEARLHAERALAGL